MMKVFLFLLLLSSVCLGQYTVGVNAFNAGELSPQMLRRYDFQKYDNGLAQCDNMLVRTQGPIIRRPGTKYVATAGDSDYAVRLIPFEYSKDDTYVLEFGDLYMRVYRNNAQVLSGPSAYEIVTPFDANELFDLQWTQIGSTMYMVDGTDPPQKLTRAGHASWTIADANIITGPFRDENAGSITVEPNATTGDITLTASSSLFDANQVGALWKITQQRTTTSQTASWSSLQTGAAVAISGEFTLFVRGDDSWVGTLLLERSDDAGATWTAVWSRVRMVASLFRDTYTYTETEDNIQYRVRQSDYTAGAVAYTLQLYNAMASGVVRITSYSSATSVGATVLKTLISTAATAKWNEGAWSDYRGWPRTVAFYEERAFYAGSESQPQTVWATKTATGQFDDYENFTDGTQAADSLSYVLPGYNPIRWVIPQTYLFVGTLGGVGRWGDPTEAITPDNPTQFRMQSWNGCDDLPAIRAADAMLYVERGGKRVRELAYSFEADRFLSPDMCVLAEHILQQGVVDVAFQARPDSILWCVLSDGNLASLTYAREQTVVAWAPHDTDGSFESVCVIPSTGEDQVWFVVNRTINGTAYRYIERMMPQDWGTDDADAFFVDSGMTWDGGDSVSIAGVTKANPGVVTVASWPADADGVDIADGDQVRISGVSGMTDLNGNVYTVDDASKGSLTFSLDNSAGTADIDTSGFGAYTTGGTVSWVERNFTGADHLEGETLDVFGDGKALADVVVSGGAFATTAWCNTINVGLHYAPQMQTLPLVGQAQAGTSLGKRGRISNVKLDFYQALGVRVGTDSTNNEAVTFYKPGTYTTDPLYTGWKQIGYRYGYTDDLCVYITQTDPYPMTIRALVYDVEVSP